MGGVVADGCFAELGEEAAGEAEPFGGFGHFGLRSQPAEGRVLDDLFDYGFGGFFPVVTGVGGGGAREVGGCDGEAVEKQAGAAGIDLIGGDAAEGVEEGELEGGAIVGVVEGEIEAGVAGYVRTATALVSGCDGTAGGVVVVTKLFVAEAGAGAAVAVGEDVAALVTDFFGVHG